jgi:hypothetical protein
MSIFPVPPPPCLQVFKKVLNAFKDVDESLASCAILAFLSCLVSVNVKLKLQRDIYRHSYVFTIQL